MAVGDRCLYIVSGARARRAAVLPSDEDVRLALILGKALLLAPTARRQQGEGDAKPGPPTVYRLAMSRTPPLWKVRSMAETPNPQNLDPTETHAPHATVPWQKAVLSASIATAATIALGAAPALSIRQQFDSAFTPGQVVALEDAPRSIHESNGPGSIDPAPSPGYITEGGTPGLVTEPGSSRLVAEGRWPGMVER
ncbi:hypothetical protein AB0C27_55955 [Nonomuraea sp. NPDC048882]|uniref:hypothetical protein n=1 Tax=Nonomuraea sp. NPDC048882 TaxID=3154347 RepID=UPI0033F337FC